MSFFRESDLKAKEILKGIRLSAVSGEKTMMTFFAFEPNAVIPLHKHPHEQITYVIEGEIEFTVEGEKKIPTFNLEVQHKKKRLQVVF